MIKLTKNQMPMYFNGEKGNYISGKKDHLVIEIKFLQNFDFKNEYEGMEYLIVLEQYLSDLSIETRYQTVIKGIAQMQIIIHKNDVKNFNELYKDFKTNMDDIMFDNATCNQEQIDELKEELKQEAEIKPCETCNFNEDGYCDVYNCKVEEAISYYCMKKHRIKEVETFVLAGKATFTLESQKTGNRYTYKVNQCNDKPTLYFVSLLTGANNETDYNYLGIIDKGNFRLTAKSKLKADSTPVKAFNFLISKLHKINQIKDLNIYHAGYCAKCGRKLTTPESIKSGFGAKCRGEL